MKMYNSEEDFHLYTKSKIYDLFKRKQFLILELSYFDNPLL